MNERRSRVRNEKNTGNLVVSNEFEDISLSREREGERERE